MEKVTQLGQKTAIAEAYRTIRANIGFSDVDNKVKTILFWLMILWIYQIWIRFCELYEN